MIITLLSLIRRSATRFHFQRPPGKERTRRITLSLGTALLVVVLASIIAIPSFGVVAVFCPYNPCPEPPHRLDNNPCVSTEDYCCPPAGGGGGHGGGPPGSCKGCIGGTRAAQGMEGMTDSDYNEMTTAERAAAGTGMPAWFVTEPTINLWLHDKPLAYSPSRGPRLEIGRAHV